jgi:release factor glutamine methyltransferase
VPDLPAIVTRLRAAGCVFAEDEAAILVASAQSPAELERFIAQRVSGLPLEHVVGWAEFCGMRVAVAPGVFVPRPRSERLVDRAREGLAAGQVVLDLCCGSGAIGLALATFVPGILLVAADLDPTATAVARANLQGLGDVVTGDLYEPVPLELRGAVAVITIVAPYVPTEDIPLLPHEARDFEPLSALDGGADGLTVLGRAVADAGEWLVPGGVLVTEVTEEQAGRVAELLEQAGLSPEIDSDEESGSTLVLGRR